MSKLIQITTDEWDEIGDPYLIAIIPFGFNELEENYPVVFDSYENEGLGEARGALVKVGQFKYFLECHPGGPEIATKVAVHVRSIEPNSKVALNNMIQFLGLKRSELVWEAATLGEAEWILTRLDDNGNEIEMRRFQNEVSANWVKIQYETKGHKQSYFVQNAT